MEIFSFSFDKSCTNLVSVVEVIDFSLVVCHCGDLTILCIGRHFTIRLVISPCECLYEVNQKITKNNLLTIVKTKTEENGIDYLFSYQTHIRNIIFIGIS
jgi:hypothetical protein